MTAVTAVDYPITAIGPSAFSEKSLTAVSIPNSVTTIGISAFAGHLMTTVHIPRSVLTIGGGAFVGFELTSVYVDGAAPTIVLAGDEGTFGWGTGITIYFYATYGAGYVSPWLGCSTAAIAEADDGSHDTANSSLAATGADASGSLVGATVLLLTGVALHVIRRRPTSRSTATPAG